MNEIRLLAPVGLRRNVILEVDGRYMGDFSSRADLNKRLAEIGAKPLNLLAWVLVSLGLDSHWCEKLPARYLPNRHPHRQ